MDEHARSSPPALAPHAGSGASLPPGAPAARRWPVALLLVIVLLAAGALRLVGVDWDERQYLHPDERFLLMVGQTLEPVGSLGEYLDTGRSTLNPENTGNRPEFVYGTWPVILVRLLAGSEPERLAELHLLGRRLSAACDLLVVLLVFLLGRRAFDRRVGLLAAAFAACAVLPIQLAHYFTVDVVSTLFVVVSLLVALSIADADTGPRAALLLAALLGVTAAAAIAAKLSAAPVVLLLPAAAFVRLHSLPDAERARATRRAAIGLLLGAITCLVAFRLLQPYAFAGPGLLDLALNPKWVRGLRNLAALSGPDADWPPAVQWARRSPLFSLVNLVRWGLGPALGLAAVAGVLAFAVAHLRRAARPATVLWAWVVAYFVWQSFAANPTMRYQLPVYAGLEIFAAWGLVELATRARDRARALRLAALAVGAAVLLATAVWAVAFATIYTRPVTRVAASRWILDHLPGRVNAVLETPAGRRQQLVRFAGDAVLAPERPFATRVTMEASGRLAELLLPHVEPVLATTRGPVSTLRLEVESGTATRAQASAPVAAAQPGGEVRLVLEPPLEVAVGQEVRLVLTLDRGAVRLAGSTLVNESSWDDGLPLRLGAIDPFDGHYEPGPTLELYWPDSEVKRERFVEALDAADALLISSNRQWGSIPRLPERWPLTTAYYRRLLGCAAEETVEACYRAARPGEVHGELGFDLVAVFESPPGLGPLRVDDQAAEEAFTVYDHPKVLVLVKAASFDRERVRDVLGTVDLERVVPVAPGRAGRHPADLRLPPERLAGQRAGGTFAALFPRANPLNRWPALAVLAWYLTLSGLGLAALPLVRRALPNLADRGLTFARLVGLLLLAYPVWLAGSAGMSVTPALIGVAAALLAAGGLALAWHDRDALRRDWTVFRRRVVVAELLFATLFALGLAARVANPDLWHPARGGEKPMDFAYLNAVLKSSTFPPYDPWFADGYVNYYYWGFVLVGVPVKWLGITPAVAYNLILPTLLALIGAAAYSVGLTLAAGWRPANDGLDPPAASRPRPETVGVAAAAAMAVLGTLATPAMVVQGLIRIGGVAAGAGPLERLGALFRGTVEAFRGTPLPYHVGEWYWNPTRIIPDPDVGPISEFPAFTFLYADLHAHYLDLAVTLLVVAWSAGVVLSARRWRERAPRPGEVVPALLLGGLAAGSLQAVNTWSYYPYLALAAASAAYAAWHAGRDPAPAQRAVAASAAAAAVATLAHLSFAPFAAWFGRAYTAVDLWHGARTPLAAYLTHWGLPLFLIGSWLAREAIVSLAGRCDPARRSRLHPWLLPLASLVAGGALAGWGIPVGLLVLPLATAAASVALDPRRDPPRRFAALLAASGLTLTLVVEVVVLRGDIGRMNTVFKLYLQAWTLLAPTAAVAAGWVVADLPAWRWRPARRLWVAAAGALVAGAALFPAVASFARARDRMAPAAPHTLDGAAFLAHAIYRDADTDLPLAEDLAAIRWLQDHVAGSPVVVEAHTPEYRWGSRISVYTGLPTVVGWSWHQRQQRGLTPQEWVLDRIAAVDDFYRTEDADRARDFLRRYDVRFVVLGRLERALYRGPGLDKFELLEDLLWRVAFVEGETTVYEVVDAARSG